MEKVVFKNCNREVIDNRCHSNKSKIGNKSRNEIKFFSLRTKGIEKAIQAPVVSTKKRLKEIYIKDGHFLGDKLAELPYGIIDKRATGIGATTLELNSKRNSLIVVPIKALAYEKHIKTKGSLYVGSRIEGAINETTSKTIEQYLNNQEIDYKKLLIVADSLPKVLEIIGKPNYKEFFLMIDEVDIIQADSIYRPRLEDSIDHYLTFPAENRCVVSATIREFSHPEMSREPITTISYEKPVKKSINLIKTNNINASTAKAINSINKNEKIYLFMFRKFNLPVLICKHRIYGPVPQTC